MVHYTHTWPQSGNFTRVPVIVGSNADEVPPSYSRDMTPEAYEAGLRDYFGDEFADKLMAMYPPEDYETPWFALQRLISDFIFSCPVRFFDAQTHVLTPAGIAGPRRRPPHGAPH